ncbi:hypothetical protein OQJ05_08805 [Fluoribacter gormanii]|uniref:hypothetical protein n=1 Tax=Fluoribacter gormanii TaxID=464 RepID=UPI002244D950|nr:hypothetical protein [Fluoribacter gormanii]MCW8444152.1 hypothetical protein [Fluoribacter gormanii]
MPLIPLYQLENAYYPKFIEALQLDMSTSDHSAEVNHQVLNAALSILKEPGKYTGISLDQIMIGTMNMAISLQISKYGTVSPESVGQDVYDKYLRESNYWFTGYNRALKNYQGLSDQDALILAIPVIERAAKSGLYITPCLSHTLNLFFEYYLQLGNDFIPPDLPAGDTFRTWNQEQFLCFNTNYSSSLLSHSLFAVKAYRLPTTNLPKDLQNELNLLSAADDGDDQDDADRTASYSCCTIV